MGRKLIEAFKFQETVFGPYFKPQPSQFLEQLWPRTQEFSFEYKKLVREFSASLTIDDILALKLTREEIRHRIDALLNSSLFPLVADVDAKEVSTLWELPGNPRAAIALQPLLKTSDDIVVDVSGICDREGRSVIRTVLRLMARTNGASVLHLTRNFQ